MNVLEIVRGYLKEHGFDGLYNSDGECGCDIKDLCPFSEMGGECEPGYLVKTPGGEYDEIYCSAKYRDELLQKQEEEAR